MDEKQFEDLAEQFRFPTWQGRRVLRDNLFVWRLELAGDEFASWEAQHVQAVPVIPEAHENRRFILARRNAAPEAEVVAYGPQLVVSTWRNPAAPGALMSVAIYQCTSAEDARSRCLLVLGEFQTLRMEQADYLEIGDVAFAAPELLTILFVRGNLVVLLRNGGKDLVSLAEAARSLDVSLIARPRAGGTTPRSRPGKALFRLKGRTAGRPLELHMVDTPGLKRARFFSQGGEVSFRDGRLTFTNPTPGATQLEAAFDGETPAWVAESFNLRRPSASGSKARSSRKPD